MIVVNAGFRVGCGLLLCMLLGLAIACPSWSAITCVQCHGTAAPPDYRPLDASLRDVVTGGFPGNHRSHMAATATVASCAPCHPGSQGYAPNHRDGKIQLANNINASPQPARYRNISTPQPQTATPVAGTCTNVNCHFERETPVWGAAPLTFPGQCATCHAVPPTTGSHPAASGPGQQHGAYYGTTLSSCSLCHPNHAGATAPFAHATSVGKGPLKVGFAAAPNNGAGAYSRSLAYPGFLPSTNPLRNGSCSNLYCHSDGKGGAPREMPTWGGALGGCGGCHDVGGSATQLSGRHDRHTGSPTYAFSCPRCHSGTVSENTTIANRTAHLNRSKDVVFREGGSYIAVDQSCAAYCHSNAGNGPARRPVNWTDSGPMTCYACHAGRTSDNTPAACTETGGTWDSAKQFCTPISTSLPTGTPAWWGPNGCANIPAATAMPRPLPRPWTATA